MTTQVSPADDTRSKILDLAELLWLGRGFNGFSYQHISRELGVKNAAIHYHFPHKEDLGIALVQRYRRRLARYIEAQANLPPKMKLERFFALADTYFENERQICPSGSLAVELHTLPDALRAEACLFVKDMQEWAVSIAKEGRAAGELRFAGSEEDMGALLCAGLQGALQLARMAPDLLEQAKAALRAQLGLAQQQ
jgi:TetR/AcrR family transcriptional repressor of nem operon